MDELKICKKCEKISPKTSSYKNKNNKDGYLNQCKKCSKTYTIRKQEKIKNFKKQYFHQNKGRVNEYKKQMLGTDLKQMLITV